MKKTFWLLLVLALLCATVLVACDGDDGPEGETPACEHASAEWRVVTEASCAAKGSKQRVCTACAEVLETAEIAMAAHVEEIVAGYAATCEADGLTDGKKCRVCNTVVLAQEKIGAKGHRESDWITDKDPTVTEEGSRHKECLTCGEAMSSEAIPVLTPDHVHVGIKWVTAIEANCQRKGKRQQVCSCGQVTATQEIAKTGHSEQDVLGTAATCTVVGLTDGKKCSVCGTFTVSQLPIQPKGHKFENGTCKNCGIAEPYGVWIVDGNGNPMTDIIVKVMKGGEQVKMVSYQGEFLAFEGLENGTYTLELDLTQLPAAYTYDAAACTLSPEKRTVTVRVFRTVGEKTEPIHVSAPIDKEYAMYRVETGSYLLPLTPNDYTFFIFTPSRAAVYTLTYECDSTLAISYHGGDFFVQGIDLSVDNKDMDSYENGLAASVYGSNLGFSYVFAVYSNGATSCVLNIENAGDPGTRLEDEPWTPYLEDEAVVNAALSATPTGTYQNVDITDLTLKAVFNEQDGYYHLGTASGPVLYIDLVSDTLFVSGLQTIGVNQRIGVYVYDENGDVLEKRSYNELFCQYGVAAVAEDAKSDPIRVPLTAKLAEAVQKFGEKQNWWREGSDTNIFVPALLGQPYNSAYAWLLYCGYYA